MTGKNANSSKAKSMHCFPTERTCRAPRERTHDLARCQQAAQYRLRPKGVLRSALAYKSEILKPYEKFAEMIDTYWDGIAAYCKPENKVPLDFVEGLNNKIRVFQRRAYGLRDEEYLRLKVLSCMLPEI